MGKREHGVVKGRDSALTATCANDARRESRDSDPHKINYCPSIITSRTSCTSPTRRKIEGKSTRAFILTQSLPPILTP
jgi:hypothetical protein